MTDALDLGGADAERALAVQYAPATRRPDVMALWELDARLGRIVSSAREPALAEIKLAWWEERLRALRDDAVPPEPLLQALVSASEIDVSDLAGIAEGWRALFADSLSPDVLRRHSGLRGRSLARAVAAALAGRVAEPMLLASEGYALADLAATRADDAERRAAFAAARDRFAQAGRLVWPRRLRPLGMIVELARGDAVRGAVGRAGSPARVARMAWHGLTGR